MEGRSGLANLLGEHRLCEALCSQGCQDGLIQGLCPRLLIWHPSTICHGITEVKPLRSSIANSPWQVLILWGTLQLFRDGFLALFAICELDLAS